MSKDKAIHKIEKKWVRENKRFFSEFPGIPRSGISGEEETWMELSQFYRDDLKWLLSLPHHEFWSYLMFSDEAHELLLNFLRKAPPHYLKNKFLVRDDMKKLFNEIEYLVFLSFLRISKEKESESCFVRNFASIIYNNYLFSVPIILDICLIYGTSNHDLVKELINNVISAAPEFLDDFQEVIPHFTQVLKTVKEKLLGKDTTHSKDKIELKLHEVEDVMLYLVDSVATMQVFFAIYPSVCQLFSKIEVITEIVKFYSNVLPELPDYSSSEQQSMSGSSLVSNLIGNVRIDLLKIVKSLLDFIVSEGNEILEKKEQIMNEFLTVMSNIVSEPVFLYDYNLLYSVEFEINCAMANFNNMDMTKVTSILEKVASVTCDGDHDSTKNFTSEVTEDGVKLNPLVSEVKDIFPHLTENFIKICLKYYNDNTERVIAAVLENKFPPDLAKSLEQNKEKKEPVEQTGNKKKVKHSFGSKTNQTKAEEPVAKQKKTDEQVELKGILNKYNNLNEMLNDREEISKMKERYAELSFVTDEMYDDEYDDTYDENIRDIPVRDTEEFGERPFVVPRVLRTKEENDDEGEEEEEEEEEEEQESEKSFGQDHFVEDPALIRQRMLQARLERNNRDVRGRGRGQGQTKQVMRNREFKESHKSFIANHNRKKQASRKMGRGMIPT